MIFTLFIIYTTTHFVKLIYIFYDCNYIFIDPKPDDYMVIRCLQGKGTIDLKHAYCMRGKDFVAEDPEWSPIRELATSSGAYNRRVRNRRV